MHTKKIPYYWRYLFLLFLLALGLAGMAWRVINLTLFDHVFLKKQGDARSLRVITLPAHRGMIFDRRHEPLAISSPVESIWINPKTFNTDQPAFSNLANLLNLDAASLKQKIKSNNNREFIYLKRQIPSTVANQIKLLQLPDLHFQEEFRRYYPEGESTAQLLGFTNIDDQGQEGIELAYNTWLEGIPGLKKVTKDRFGAVVDEFDLVRAPKAGNPIELSIDRRIQFIAYQALEKGVTQFHAEAGSAVILDPRTNEILAITNYPSFNPNQRETSLAEHRNRAVTDLFEPGSTIKAFSVANALISGKYYPDTVINTTPGWLIIDGKRVQDVHNKGNLDLTGILKYSSNVGVAKLTLSLPSHNLWALLHDAGFGELTNINLPGERTGVLKNHLLWKPFTLATLSFGYGMNSTALQLAQAYSLIANKGVKIPLSLFPSPKETKGKQVIDEKIATSLIKMMETVVEKDGTAPLARVPGYLVSGKTSTTNRVGAEGYLKHSYNTSFIGIVPADNPRLVIVVVLYNISSRPYFGGYTAGPIFANIAEQSLPMLGIPPSQNTTKIE